VLEGSEDSVNGSADDIEGRGGNDRRAIRISSHHGHRTAPCTRNQTERTPKTSLSRSASTRASIGVGTHELAEHEGARGRSREALLAVAWTAFAGIWPPRSRLEVRVIVTGRRLRGRAARVGLHRRGLRRARSGDARHGGRCTRAPAGRAPERRRHHSRRRNGGAHSVGPPGYAERERRQHHHRTHVSTQTNIVAGGPPQTVHPTLRVLTPPQRRVRYKPRFGSMRG